MSSVKRTVNIPEIEDNLISILVLEGAGRVREAYTLIINPQIYLKKKL